MQKINALWCIILFAVGGCDFASCSASQVDGELVAATFSKAALHIFDNDHVEYDQSVEQVFSARELEVLRDNISSLEPMIEFGLSRQDSIWGAKLAAYFKVEKAVGSIRFRLLIPRHCYGWEGPDYSKLESFLADNQFPYSVVYLEAIEEISAKPVRQAIALTLNERKEIERISRYTHSQYYHWALWIKRKLNGNARSKTRAGATR